MTEEYKSEFIFELIKPIPYHEGGKTVFAKQIIFKAPSNKQRRESAELKQGFMEALNGLNNKDEAKKDEKTKDDKEKIEGIDVISIIMMSKAVNYVDYQESFRTLMLNDIAYVTVRSGGQCGGTLNQLDVIDVSNVSSPILVNSYSMKNPHGLGIDGDLLMVCDGNGGLRIFDATDPLTAGKTELYAFKNVQATDVIPMNGVAMLIGDDGIYQYDYTDPSDIQLLSKIKF